VACDLRIELTEVSAVIVFLKTEPSIRPFDLYRLRINFSNYESFYTFG